MQLQLYSGWCHLPCLRRHTKGWIRHSSTQFECQCIVLEPSSWLLSTPSSVQASMLMSSFSYILHPRSLVLVVSAHCRSHSCPQNNPLSVCLRCKHKLWIFHGWIWSHQCNVLWIHTWVQLANLFLCPESRWSIYTRGCSLWPLKARLMGFQN